LSLALWERDVKNNLRITIIRVRAGFPPGESWFSCSGVRAGFEVWIKKGPR
jgi:hypothetical protein